MEQLYHLSEISLLLPTSLLPTVRYGLMSLDEKPVATEERNVNSAMEVRITGDFAF